MRTIEFDHPLEFANEVLLVLLEREAENNLLLGIIGRLTQVKPPGSIWCAVRDDHRVIGVATLTPPHRIVISRMPLSALKALANHVNVTVGTPKGVVGPLETADEFAREWSRQTGGTTRQAMKLRIYQLHQVIPAPATSGLLRAPHPEERELVVQWMREFAQQIGEPHSDLEAAADRRLADDSIYLWDDREPVSMAGWAGPTPNGERGSHQFRLHAAMFSQARICNRVRRRSQPKAAGFGAKVLLSLHRPVECDIKQHLPANRLSGRVRLWRV